MPLPRRLPDPDPDCACAVACGVKPEPPPAVAARGLTPHATAKPRSGSDLARATISVAATLRPHRTTHIPQGANRTDGTLVRTRTRTLRSVIARSARRNAGNLVRVTHRGQRSFPTAQTGRIHERSRPLRRHRFCFLPNGGRPYMSEQAFGGRADFGTRRLTIQAKRSCLPLRLTMPNRSMSRLLSVVSQFEIRIASTSLPYQLCVGFASRAMVVSRRCRRAGSCQRDDEGRRRSKR